MNRFWKKLLGQAPLKSVLEQPGVSLRSMLRCGDLQPKPDPWKLTERQERALRRRDFRDRIARPLRDRLSRRT